MKNTIIKFAGILMASGLLFSSCKKDYDTIFNMFEDVDVTFHANSPYAVTDYKEVNAGDSLYLDFTITSAKKNMFMVCVWEAGAAVPFIKIPLDNTQRRNFSYTAKLKMDSKVGRTSYRVWALDSAGVFIGDGYKKITVDVLSDFNYWAGRNLYVPDSTDKVDPCYLSLATGSTFSYTTGAANSGSIDIGYAYNGSHTLYALNNSPLPFTVYDISSWTPRATLLANPKNNQASTWLNQLRTGAQIEKNAKSAKPTNKKVTGLKAGSLVYFLTPEGKYGALYINYVTQDNAKRGTIMNVDVKIQK